MRLIITVALCLLLAGCGAMEAANRPSEWTEEMWAEYLVRYHETLSYQQQSARAQFETNWYLREISQKLDSIEAKLDALAKEQAE